MTHVEDSHAKPASYDNINRMGDVGYWLELMIARHVSHKDVHVDAKKIVGTTRMGPSQEYLLRFAQPDDSEIGSEFRDGVVNVYQRYQRNADGEFHKLESGHRRRYARISTTTGLTASSGFLCTHVRANLLSYAYLSDVAAALFKFELQEKEEAGHFESDGLKKEQMLLANQLHRWREAELMGGGMPALTLDFEKIIEVLHRFHDGMWHWPTVDRNTLYIDMDRSVVSRAPLW